MATSTFTQPCIAGVAAVVGQQEASVDDFIELYGGDYDRLAKMKELMGIDRRYVASPQTTAGDLCLQATETLLEKTALDRKDVQALIMVTQTPDHTMPATAAILHHKLGLGRDCAAFDVNLGCSGWLYGLWLAFQMIETRSASNVLVLAGDTLSRLTSPRDKSVAALFGDAGTATLVTTSPDSTASHFRFYTDGSGSRHLIVPAGGFRQAKSAESRLEACDSEGNYRSAEHLYMNGGAVFTFSTRVAPAAVRELAAVTGRELADFDVFLFHQANKFIITSITRSLGVPMELTPYRTMEKYGNLSVSSIPVSICDEPERFAGRRRIMACAFGVGLSWGVASFETDNLITAPVARCKN